MAAPAGTTASSRLARFRQAIKFASSNDFILTYRFSGSYKSSIEGRQPLPNLTSLPAPRM